MPEGLTAFPNQLVDMQPEPVMSQLGRFGLSWAGHQNQSELVI